MSTATDTSRFGSGQFCSNTGKKETWCNKCHIAPSSVMRKAYKTELQGFLNWKSLLQEFVQRIKSFSLFHKLSTAQADGEPLIL